MGSYSVMDPGKSKKIIRIISPLSEQIQRLGAAYKGA
jgi:hypothetical protein